MNYFTRKGAENAKNCYSELLGKKFYFKKGQEKYELLNIEIQPSKAENGYYVNFIAENGIIALFNDFLLLNGFPNDFDNYEQTTEQISI